MQRCYWMIRRFTASPRREKDVMSSKMIQRTVRQAGERYQLCEPSFFYNAHLEAKNDDIGRGNAYFWNIYD